MEPYRDEAGRSMVVRFSPKTHMDHGECYGDFGSVPMTLTRSTYLYALCAALNSCNLGYDIGVSTGAGRLIQTDLGLTRGEREIFTGSMNFWAIFGALGAHYISDKLGRRLTFAVAAFGFISGILISVISSSYSLLLVGRALIGLGEGVGLAIDPLYIAEVTPARYRGELVTWSEIAINVGIVLGFSSNLLLAGMDYGAQWRVMLLLGCIMPVVMTLTVFTIMPETPRWLVANGRFDEARTVLANIYPSGFNIELVLLDIQEAIARDSAAQRAVGWSQILNPAPAFRRMLMVGIGIAVAQQAVGIDAIQYYLLDILEKSGIDSTEGQNLALIFLGIIKLIFVFVGGKCFDAQGRRPLLFLSLIGMAFALILLGISDFVQFRFSSRIQISCLALYLAFFSTGMGPGAWLIPSEVFSVSIRAKAMSLAGAMNRVTATFMSSTFLSTAHAVGFGVFFLLLGITCLIVLAFLYTFLPETKGRSLEDMTMYFAQITGDGSILEAEELVRQQRSQQDYVLTSFTHESKTKQMSERLLSTAISDK